MKFLNNLDLNGNSIINSNSDDVLAVNGLLIRDAAWYTANQGVTFTTVSAENGTLRATYNNSAINPAEPWGEGEDTDWREGRKGNSIFVPASVRTVVNGEEVVYTVKEVVFATQAKNLVLPRTVTKLTLNATLIYNIYVPYTVTNLGGTDWLGEENTTIINMYLEYDEGVVITADEDSGTIAYKPDNLVEFEGSESESTLGYLCKLPYLTPKPSGGGANKYQESFTVTTVASRTHTITAATHGITNPIIQVFEVIKEYDDNESEWVAVSEELVTADVKILKGSDEGDVVVKIGNDYEITEYENDTFIVRMIG